ncbi:MAG: hypothetical protein OXC95_09900, partial [Dehalococcoidia bacterium]|nr:hypothetical protein [Dehalococcoidia bacterium]
RELAWELGRERNTEDDIVGQPVHHCYVRASVATERLPAFSMTVRTPEFGDPEVAEPIRKEAAAHLTSAEDLAAQQAERQRRADQLAAEAEKGQVQTETPAEPPRKGKRKSPRSRRKMPAA